MERLYEIPYPDTVELVKTTSDLQEKLSAALSDNQLMGIKLQNRLIL